MSADPTTAFRLQFPGEPDKFLEAAGHHLASDPVISTVVTTMAHRRLSRPASDGSPGPEWWLVVRDEAGAVAGARGIGASDS